MPTFIPGWLQGMQQYIPSLEFSTPTDFCMDYLKHLAKDKKLQKHIFRHAPVKLHRRKDLHLHLCGSIVSQQLSTKVAAAIHRRFLQLYPGRPTALQILQTTLETLRAVGLSRAKATYIHNVARFSLEQGLDHKLLGRKTDEEVIAYLTQIKGVGRWTAEMILMFALGREDVFAVDDLGIRQAMKKIYHLDDSDKKAFKEKMLTIAQKWRPYRTYACIHLWQSKDAAN